jgi:hypothetical protein
MSVPSSERGTSIAPRFREHICQICLNKVSPDGKSTLFLFCHNGDNGCGTRLHPSCLMTFHGWKDLSQVQAGWHCDRCKDAQKTGRSITSKDYACTDCAFGDWYVYYNPEIDMWVHPVCEMATPEYTPSRCDYCSYDKGAPARCFAPGCTRSFHVPCFLDKCNSQRKFFIELPPKHRYMVCLCEQHEHFPLDTSSMESIKAMLLLYFGLFNVPHRSHVYQPPSFVQLNDSVEEEKESRKRVYVEEKVPVVKRGRPSKHADVTPQQLSERKRFIRYYMTHEGRGLKHEYRRLKDTFSCVKRVSQSLQDLKVYIEIHASREENVNVLKSDIIKGINVDQPRDISFVVVE